MQRAVKHKQFRNFNICVSMIRMTEIHISVCYKYNTIVFLLQYLSDVSYEQNKQNGAYFYFQNTLYDNE